MFLVLGMVNSAMAVLVKVDLSCSDAGTKAGGDWQDFFWAGGCDGEMHDDRAFTTSEGYTFRAGDPGGHSNLVQEGGDALVNTRLCNPTQGNELVRNHFRVSGLEAGDYEIEVVGEDTSGTYYVTSAGPGNQYTIFDKTGGLDNFILTSLGPVVTGACCLPDGSCVDDETEADCAAAGGTYQGDDVLCIDVTCPVIAGACCLPDGLCVDEETEADCVAAGGTYQGDDVLCVDVTCPQPPVIGACCLGNENCVDGLTEAECVVAPYNGRFMGEDSECVSVDCSAGGCDAEECEALGYVDPATICNGDFNSDGWLSPSDISALVNTLLPHASNSYWKICD